MELVRLNVNLTVRSANAMERLAELRGVSKTDAVNQALQIAAELEEIQAAGGRVYTREAGSNEVQRIRFL